MQRPSSIQEWGVFFVWIISEEGIMKHVGRLIWVKGIILLFLVTGICAQAHGAGIITVISEGGNSIKWTIDEHPVASTGNYLLLDGTYYLVDYSYESVSGDVAAAYLIGCNQLTGLPLEDPSYPGTPLYPQLVIDPYTSAKIYDQWPFADPEAVITYGDTSGRISWKSKEFPVAVMGGYVKIGWTIYRIEWSDVLAEIYSDPGTARAGLVEVNQSTGESTTTIYPDLTNMVGMPASFYASWEEISGGSAAGSSEILGTDMRSIAINNTGDAVWSAFDPATGLFEIYSKQRGQLTSGGSAADKDFPDVNDSGDVVWQQLVAGPMGPIGEIRALLAGSEKLIAESSERVGAVSPSINNRGEIVWMEYSNAYGNWVIKSNVRGIISDPSISSYSPSINSNGDVVWIESTKNGHLVVKHLPFDGFLPAVQVSDGLAEVFSPSISDSGEIVWVQGSQQNILVSNLKGELPTGTGINRILGPDISDTGSIVFVEEDAANGIYLARLFSNWRVGHTDGGAAIDWAESEHPTLVNGSYLEIGGTYYHVMASGSDSTWFGPMDGGGGGFGFNWAVLEPCDQSTGVPGGAMVDVTGSQGQAITAYESWADVLAARDWRVVHSDGGSAIDWHASEHSMVAMGSYLEIAGVFYYVLDSGVDSSWFPTMDGGPGFNWAFLQACDQSTGAPVGGILNFSGAQGQTITAYMSWEEVMSQGLVPDGMATVATAFGMTVTYSDAEYSMLPDPGNTVRINGVLYAVFGGWHDVPAGTVFMDLQECDQATGAPLTNWNPVTMTDEPVLAIMDGSDGASIEFFNSGASGSVNVLIVMPISGTNKIGFGTGGGNVISRDGNINVPMGPPGHEYPSGTQMALMALPDLHSRFAGWSYPGCDPLNPICVVPVNGGFLHVETLFEYDLYPVNVFPMSILNGMEIDNGSGTIVSSDGMIDSPFASPGFEYKTGSQVELTAIPEPNSRFAGWSDPACNPLDPVCTITVAEEFRHIEAYFKYDLYPVNVFPISILNGMEIDNGSGTIVSSDGMIDSPFVSPGFEYKTGSQVELTAIPDPNSRFAGWSDPACDSLDPVCTITVAEEFRHIEAYFMYDLYMLDTLAMSVPNGVGIDSGLGNIVSSDGFIDFQMGLPAYEYKTGTQVTLTAVPDPNSRFAGWNDPACNPLDPVCTVTIDETSRHIDAFFVYDLYPLDVMPLSMGNPLGNFAGMGNIVSSDGFIDFQMGLPAYEYKTGTQVTLTAVPDPNSRFAGWNDPACNPLDPVCTVTIDETSRHIDAFFVYDLYPLDVMPLSMGNPLGNFAGMGNIVSSDGFIDFQMGLPAYEYKTGTQVTLTAVPDPNSRFAGWNDPACNPLDPVCTVTIDETSRRIDAFFMYDLYPLDVLPMGMPNALGGEVWGIGNIVSSDGFIDFQMGSPGYEYKTGTQVTLTAEPHPNSRFAGWNDPGCDPVNPVCTVTIDETSRRIDAFFMYDLYPLDVSVDPGSSGMGSVVSDVGGIDTANALNFAEFKNGTLVTLSATSNAGSAFVSWSVPACGANPSCTVTMMDQIQSVTAFFGLDIDGDGVPDGLDVCNGNDASGDTDSDLTCNDLDTDDDGDGLPDAWEIVYTLDPLDATGINGAAGDPDADSLTNAGELAAGTDPRNPDTDGDTLLDGVDLAPLVADALPPTAFFVPASSTTGNFTLTWTNPAQVDGFEIEESTTGTFTGTPTYTLATAVSSFEVTGRTPGTYSYRIRGTKSGLVSSDWVVGGDGCLVEIKILAPNWISLPSTSHNGDVGISWAGVVGPNMIYVLEEAKNTDFIDSTVVYSGSFQLVTLSGRADGTYYYRVKTTSNGYLDSAWTNTLTGCSVLTPKAPLWLSVPLNSSDGTINISWPASFSLGAKYILEESINSNFQGAEIVYSNISTSTSLYGRNAGSYYYRIKTQVTGYGDSAYSISGNSCTVAGLVPPNWISVPTGSNDGTLSINWDTVPTTGIQYVLQEATDPEFSNAVSLYIGTATSWTLTGRNAGTYYYRVQTRISGVGNSSFVSAFNSCAVVGLVPPNWISVPTGSNDGTLSISWATVPTPGILYVLQEATDPEFSNAVSLYIGSATSRTLTGRNSGTYYYRVQTRVSGVGSSSFVSASNSCAVVGLVPPNWISVPTGSNDGTFSISWAMVPTPGILYVLQEATDPEFSNAVSLYIGSATNRTLTGRNAGTYYYRVQTRVSGVGSSSFVSASNSCAVVGLVPTNWVSVPTESNDGTIGVSWAVVPTPGILYVLQEATDPGFSDVVSLYTGSSTNRTITGRNNGTYYYRVQTRVSGVGSSPFRSASNKCIVSIP
jgi:hypothetical protein